jgi:hypothetical protein
MPLTRSDCCNSDVRTSYGGLLGMPYWICKKCNKPCDTIKDKVKEDVDAVKP